MYCSERRARHGRILRTTFRLGSNYGRDPETGQAYWDWLLQACADIDNNDHLARQAFVCNILVELHGLCKTLPQLRIFDKIQIANSMIFYEYCLSSLAFP
jgi:hypothetical protein